MKIRKFNESLLDDLKSKLSEENLDIKEEIIELIENSISSSDLSLVSDFIVSFINDPETTTIEGLSNDSDVYEFYLKFTNDIDEILQDMGYFEESPSSKGTLGLYSYLVKGTRDAVKKVMLKLKDEI
tara:strand:+ start:380 stop:760 length:381 start_codon:yes stop_codon:yes gene_type:complete